MSKKWNSDDFGSPAEDAARNAELEAEAKRRGLAPWQVAAARAVPDKLIADLVSDAYRSNPVTHVRSLGADTGKQEAKPRGSGWAEPARLATPHVAACDRLMDAADAADRRAKIAELQKATARIERRVIRHSDRMTEATDENGTDKRRAGR
jgi:hypothetical protein